jgi:hypothetical protein
MFKGGKKNSWIRTEDNWELDPGTCGKVMPLDLYHTTHYVSAVD